MSKGHFAGISADLSERILEGIRAPEREPLIDAYVNSRPKEVSDILLKLAETGEAGIAATFIASDSGRFERLAERDQLPTLMLILESMDITSRLKVLCATENDAYGIPDATVMRVILSSSNADAIEKLTGIMRNFDSDQRTEIMAAPGTMWWMSSHDHLQLMYETLSTLSVPQRQKIYGSAETPQLAI